MAKWNLLWQNGKGGQRRPKFQGTKWSLLWQKASCINGVYYGKNQNMKTEFTMAKKPQHTYSIAMVEQDLKLSKSRKMMLNPCDFKIFEGDILACVILKRYLTSGPLCGCAYQYAYPCNAVRTPNVRAPRYAHPIAAPRRVCTAGKIGNSTRDVQGGKDFF